VVVAGAGHAYWTPHSMIQKGGEAKVFRDLLVAYGD
jgi:hypothetical protein